MPRVDQVELDVRKTVVFLLMVSGSLIGSGHPVALASGVKNSNDFQKASQVTLVAVQATPGSQVVDPRLGGVRTQLKQILPNHGFQLLDAKSQRILQDQSVRCDLGEGSTAEVLLRQVLDDTGKLELQLLLLHEGQAVFSTFVKTPSNQLFFLERTLMDGRHILIGVGAR